MMRLQEVSGIDHGYSKGLFQLSVLVDEEIPGIIVKNASGIAKNLVCPRLSRLSRLIFFRDRRSALRNFENKWKRWMAGGRVY